MNVLSAELGGACGRVSEGVGGGAERDAGACVCALGRRVRPGDTERCGAGRLHVCLCAGVLAVPGRAALPGLRVPAGVGG